MNSASIQTVSCIQIQIQKTAVMFFIDVMAVHSAYCFSRMLHTCLSLCMKLHANKSSGILLTCVRLERPLHVRPNACYAGYTPKDFLHLIRFSKCDRPQTWGQKILDFSICSYSVWCAMMWQRQHTTHKQIFNQSLDCEHRKSRKISRDFRISMTDDIQEEIAIVFGMIFTENSREKKHCTHHYTLT